MTTSRRTRIQQVSDLIGKRQLIWFGTRGADAQPLLEFAQFAHCVSLVAPLDALSIQTDACLETIRRHRVDLNAYHTDVDESDEAHELHKQLVRVCGAPAVLVAYRPAAFLTSAYFPRSELVQYLGVFHERQTAFEHKPWAETELRSAGVQVVPWRYFCDEDLNAIEESLDSGPLVLRVNRSSGGSGLSLIRDLTELTNHWPGHRDRFLAASPFLDPNIPLNVGGCVFRDGSVSAYTPSLQLIGLNACTTRKFGYCGNDFAQVRSAVDYDVLDSLEMMTVRVGKWLHSMGYLGAFGIDAILHDGNLYLTEVNPRFQGSSALSARLSRAMDLPDIYLDHMAAFFGIEQSAPVSLREQSRNQPALSQVISYNRGPYAVRRHSNHFPDDAPLSLQLVPAPDISVANEAILFKLVVNGAVTNNGLNLTAEHQTKVETLQAELFDAGPGMFTSTTSVGVHQRLKH